MCTYSTFMYMPGTLKADHWRLPTGTPNCHIVAGVKTLGLAKSEPEPDVPDQPAWDKTRD